MKFLSGLVFSLIISLPLSAQVTLTPASYVYTQNFNSLSAAGSWSNNTTLPGWYTKTDNTASITAYGVNTGSSTTAGLYSYGKTGDTDRAFGFASSNSFSGSSGVGKNYMGLRFSNAGSSDIQSLTISWTGEQWRKENNASTNKLVVSYQTGTNLTDPKAGTWTTTTSEFISPVVGATTAAALDGTLSANSVSNITFTLPVTVSPGQEIMLRWEDLNDSGNDHQLAIDDISVSAEFAGTTPEVLVVKSVTPSSLYADSLFSLTVESRSASGVATPLTRDTYLTLSVDTGTGSLTGTTEAVMDSGLTVFTFSALSYSKAETGVILKVVTSLGDTLSDALSSGLTFSAVTNPTKLVISSISPSNPVVNQAFSVTVSSADEMNTLQKVATDTGFLLSTSGTGLAGTLTGTIPAGSNSVTLSSLSFSEVQSDITFTATRTSGDDLSAGISSSFSVTGPVKLAFKSVSPSSPATGSVFTVVVESQDAGSTAQSVSTNTLVTLSLASGTGTLGGTLTDTIKAGTSSVTFDDLTFSKGGTITLQAVQTDGTPVLTAGTSSSISIQPGAETLPFTENFEYTAGINITASGNNWAAHSGSGSNAIKVVSPGLSFDGSPHNAVGNAIAITATGEDVNKTFAPVSSGSIYFSFMLNVTSVPAADYFIHLASTPVASTFGAKVYIKSQGTGFTLGIAKTGSSAAYSAVEYGLDTTHYIVVKYTFNTGATDDDLLELFVDPALGGAEPLPTVFKSTGETDFSGSLGAICIRQGSSSPHLTLDALSVSTVWEESTLPVELVSFIVTGRGTSALLKWETASEKNNAGFEILKSADQTAWTPLGFVSGKGTTTEKQTYNFTDAVVTGKAFYRLRQLDTDGSESWSPILSFTAIPSEFRIEGNYPNPFNPETTIRFLLPDPTHVVVKVHNTLGQEIATLVNGKLDAGVQELRFDARNLASGLYFCSVTANGKTLTHALTLLK